MHASADAQKVLAQTQETSSMELPLKEIVLSLAIAGLGFLVDMYDVVLFAVLRIPSLQSLGVQASHSLDQGVFLLNSQMLGMMLGGVLWGVLGDKGGRKSVLFGSIIIYSLANLANAFVCDIPWYCVCRFFAGIGLAGEVGAAMTIAAEVTPAKYRGYGTAAVGGIGLAGAFLAGLAGGTLPWRVAYCTAGLAGLLLLLLRMFVKETPIFERLAANRTVKRGSVRLLLQRDRIVRLLKCVTAGLPLWFAIGVIVSFGPELIANEKHEDIILSVATLALFYSFGETVGEAMSGVASQLLQSRKKALFIFLAGAFLSTAVALGGDPKYYAICCIPLGFFLGSWSVLITSVAEQFGTNLRATATTIVPNLIRSTSIPITLAFGTLSPLCGTVGSAVFVGAVCFMLAAVAILFMEETYGKSLDFVER